MTTMQSIADEIDKLVEANTLSGAGVKAMEALRVKVIALDESLVRTTDALKESMQKVVSRDTELMTVKADLSSWVAREGALVKREAEITKLEKDAAVAAGRCMTYQECFGLVFRNAEIRETFKALTPVVIPTQGGSGYSTTHETRTEVARQQT